MTALLGCLCALALATAQDARPGRALSPAEWERVWTEVEAVLALPAAAPARAPLVRALAADAAQRDPSERGDLLRAVLQRFSDRSPTLSYAPAQPWPWNARESWIAAAILDPGPTRESAVIAALGPLDLAASSPQLVREQVELAFQTWIAAADALRFDSALAIGRNLHARTHATWSAISLALSLMRAGLAEECDAVLAAQLALAADTPADLALLWDQRGIAALGAGWDRRARIALGSGLLYGSSDAAVVLARLDLAAGRLDAARAGFRAVLCENPDSDWARRGWGLALLPPRPGPGAAQAPSW